MKGSGGVTCLGGMFCRRIKVKNATIEEVMVVKEEVRGSILSDGKMKENSSSFLGKGDANFSSHDIYGLQVLKQEASLEVDVDNTFPPDVNTKVESRSRCQEGITAGVVDSSPPRGTMADADSLTQSDLFRSSSETVAADSGFEGDVENVPVGAEEAEIVIRRCDADDEHPRGSRDGRSEAGRMEELSSPEEGRVMGNDSRRYYDELSLSGGYTSIRKVGDNSFQDLELASGHVSDPDSYSKGERESACSSPNIHGCEAVETKSHEELPTGVASREFDFQDNVSVFSCPQAAAVPSYDSGSSTTGEVRNEVFIRVVGSPKSEAAYQCSASDAVVKYGSSISGVEAFKKKPWWKVFLVSHRNIHRCANTGRTPHAQELVTLVEGDQAGNPSPVNGYVSDVEDRSFRISPYTKNERTPDGHVENRRKEEKAGGSLLRNSYSEQDLQRQASGETPTKEELVYCREVDGADLHPSWNERFVSSEKSRPPIPSGKGDAFTEKMGLSRVEEWVSNVPLMPTLDEDQFEHQAEILPDSPTAPATAFFTHFSGEKSSFAGQEDKHGASRLEGVVDADQEMARMVARSVNSLSTVAHFSGVGLKVLPSLAVYTGLKTLNLSGNYIVRIAPGCLPKSLHRLDLSRNQIVMIEGLRELTRLRALDLSFNRISRIGNGLLSCTSLKELYLAGNKISEVEGIHRLSKLAILDLSFNKLTTIKSLGQIAANYKSLQALNLSDNEVLSNLGDDHIRRFVTAVCPQVLYLNKQPMKTISGRDAIDKNIARAALGKSGGGKVPSKSSKRASTHSASSNHRRTHSGGGGKSKTESKVVSPVLGGDPHHHRKSHHSSSSQDKSSLIKEMRKGFVPLPESAYPLYIERKGPPVERSKYSSLPRVRSDDTLYREHKNSGSSPQLSELVEAH
ncbi:hypothetical protein R1flu_011026 [Riccia fluitans]|uniref:Uncharacterized protein n=1 Tax=Riccia fluitans TaxID=41844 RepID=A0ABD1Z6N6_9MARC